MKNVTAPPPSSSTPVPPKIPNAVTRYVSGYRFPVFYYCCICVPLKVAVFLIALWGVVPTIVCLYLSSPYGKKILIENGVPEVEVDAIIVFYGALGAMVFTFHILLLVAEVARVARFYIAYLAFVLFYLILQFVLVTVMCVEALRFRNIEFGIICLVSGLCNEMIYLYFWIIVQSKLQVTKCDGNVVHINMTLV